MSMTYCDKCHFEWQITEADIQTIELNSAQGTKMRFFQCPECSEEYIIDATDKELRKDISVFKKMQRKYTRMYNAHESQTRLSNYLTKVEAKRKELLERQTLLRKEWCNGK